MTASPQLPRLAADPLAIRKSVTVPLRPEDAFRLFTERLGDWWPVDSHSVSARSGRTPRKVTVEPRQGGRIVETTPDGRAAPWGRITAWVPGTRLVIAWHVGHDEDDATEVEVIFTPVDTGTRVDLTHGGFGATSAAKARADGYRDGWRLVLGGYSRAAMLVTA